MSGGRPWQGTIHLVSVYDHALNAADVVQNFAAGADPVSNDTPGNAAPVANNDSYTATEGNTLNVAAAGVLANDTDRDNDTDRHNYSLMSAVVNGPSHGSLTLNDNGSFDDTPANNFSGNDSFIYRASDGNGGRVTGVDFGNRLQAAFAAFASWADRI